MLTFFAGFVVGGLVVFGVGGANYRRLRETYLVTKRKLEDAETYIKTKFKDGRR